MDSPQAAETNKIKKTENDNNKKYENMKNCDFFEEMFLSPGLEKDVKHQIL